MTPLRDINAAKRTRQSDVSNLSLRTRKPLQRIAENQGNNKRNTNANAHDSWADSQYCIWIDSSLQFTGYGVITLSIVVESFKGVVALIFEERETSRGNNDRHCN